MPWRCGGTGVRRGATRGATIAALAAALLGLAPATARAADGDPLTPGEPGAEAAGTATLSTFDYLRPAPVLRLRLGLEEFAMVTIGFVGYLIWNPPPAWPGVPEVDPLQKLSFRPGTWAFDNDTLATNFIGHATAGTLYYLFARANRVSIGEAALWTVGASTLWELVEFKEPMSINDLVLTPVAGIAIGEAFTQLSGWFDAHDDLFSRIMAWVLDPPRKLHDWMDGAVPRRDPARLGWHEFQLAAGAGAVLQEGAARAAVEVTAFTRTFRVPGRGAPGRSSSGFSDGNVSALTFNATFAARRVTDLLFDTETAFLGWYGRDLSGEGEALRGWDLYLGATVAYEYGWHVWDLAGNGPTDDITMVRLPGGDLRARAFLGGVELEGAVDVALDFAGVMPFGAPGPEVLPAGAVFPTVYVAAGYYFALGLHVAPALKLRWGGWAVGAGARTDLFRGFTGPFVPQAPGQVAVFRDGRTLASAWTRYRFASPPLEVALRADWRDRWGQVEGVRVGTQERSFFATLAWVF